MSGGVIQPAYFEPGGDDAAARGDEEARGRLRVSLGDGPGASRSLGCDLSYEYVRINGEYTT